MPVVKIVSSAKTCQVKFTFRITALLFYCKTLSFWEPSLTIREETPWWESKHLQTQEMLSDKKRSLLFRIPHETFSRGDNLGNFWLYRQRGSRLPITYFRRQPPYLIFLLPWCASWTQSSMIIKNEKQNTPSGGKEEKIKLFAEWLLGETLSRNVFVVFFREEDLAIQKKGDVGDGRRGIKGT